MTEYQIELAIAGELIFHHPEPAAAVFVALQRITGLEADDDQDTGTWMPQFNNICPPTQWVHFNPERIGQDLDLTMQAVIQTALILQCRGHIDLSPDGKMVRTRVINRGAGVYEFTVSSSHVIPVGATKQTAERRTHDTPGLAWSEPPPNPTPQTDPGFVYVMATHPGRGPYKVGKSKRPAERQRQLQNTVPDKLHILHAWPSDQYSHDERQMHYELTEHRVHGEYFACDLDLILAAAQSIGLVAV